MDFVRNTSEKIQLCISCKSAVADSPRTAPNLDAILSNDYRTTFPVEQVDERWLEGHGPTVTAYGVVVQGEGWVNYSIEENAVRKTL